MLDEMPAAHPHDLLFVPSGGKDRIPNLVKALRAAQVPVAVIADFDMLRSDQTLRRLVELASGDWEELERDLRVVRAEVGGDRAVPSVAATSAALNELLSGTHELYLTPALSKKVRELTKVDDGWTYAKRGGLRVLPQGGATDRCKTLLERLAQLGIFLVPVGELERWDATIESEKTKWVAEALAAGVHRQNQELREFVHDVGSYLGDRHGN